MNKRALFIGKVLGLCLNLNFCFYEMAMAVDRNAVESSEDSQEFAEAIKDAQELLNNQQRKHELFQSDPGARAADSRVHALTSGDTALSSEIYQLSGQVLERLAKEAGNDPEKLKKIVENLQRDPQSLDRFLGIHENAKIKNISQKIEENNKSKSAIFKNSYKSP